MFLRWLAFISFLTRMAKLEALGPTRPNLASLRVHSLTPLNCGNWHCGPHVAREYYGGSWLLCALGDRGCVWACERASEKPPRKRKGDSGWMKREQGAVHSSACDPNPRVHSTSGSRVRTYSKIAPLSPLHRAKNCPSELRGPCIRHSWNPSWTRTWGMKLGVLLASTTENALYPRALHFFTQPTRSFDEFNNLSDDIYFRGCGKAFFLVAQSIVLRRIVSCLIANLLYSISDAYQTTKK